MHGVFIILLDFVVAKTKTSECPTECNLTSFISTPSVAFLGSFGLLKMLHSDTKQLDQRLVLSPYVHQNLKWSRQCGILLHEQNMLYKINFDYLWNLIESAIEF